jgi:hypothetical protein
MHLVRKSLGARPPLTRPALAALLALKANPCADCGKCYPPEAMDFDHVPGRGGKLHNISRLRTLRAILAESEKCELVCSNCHRTRTKRRRLDVQNEKRERGSQIAAIGK